MSALLSIALLAGFALLMGWHRRARPWAEATGWSRISAAERPDDAVRDLMAAQGLRVGWLGHAGFVIEWGGHTLLLDPNVSRTCCLVAPRLIEEPGDLARLPGVEAVCLSHAHYDHLDTATLRALPSVGRLILPAGCAAYVEGVQPGAGRDELRAGDQVALGDLTVTAVPAAHNGNRFHPWKSRQPALGYVLARGGFSLYFAGDTAARNPFDRIAREHHPDIAILPIGAYSPTRPLRHYHLDPEEAVAAARALGVRGVIPCHFATLRLSFEPATEPLARFARAAAGSGLPWMMPQLWQPGGPS